ncbi:MAG: HAMP domain-containing histidine kinase, partial [Clostridia bacterium]|nr:HAMP domain-containing histidine kinase [Clostridia bacterium]
GVIALSAALSCKLKIKKLDLRIPMSVLAAVCIILGLLYPWYNLVALNVTARIIGCVLAAATIAVQVINAARKIRNLNALSATASSVFLLYISLVQDTSNFLSPSNWLCFMMLLLIICIGCSEFVKMERASVNYTKNLKKEVEAQTNSLQTMLDEREDLLRFVSHDMRKPVKAMDKFLATLSARERDAENMKTIGILQSKTQELGHSLDELSRYSKINYIAEEAETFDCSEITDKVYGLLGPDCSANGIIFNYTPANIMIFAKRKSLESILTNLIINAIEHSDCTEIALAAEKKKDKCIITVADNGNGIESSAALFSPYGGADDEHGLGLYICRRYAEAMNSSIAAERRENLTIFYVTLPLS